jgi:hypothetical protein
VPERIGCLSLWIAPRRPQEVTAVTIELPGGVKAWHYPLPPEDFNPLEADEETLTRYGFPHRPRNPELLRLWKKVLGRPIKILEAGYEIAEGRHPHRPHGRITDNLSEDWSGAQITSAPGQVFENVIGTWNVPNTYPDPNDSGLSKCVSWIGISDGNGNLLQAGVESDVDNTPDHYIYAWWTLLPMQPIQLKVPVSAGDNVLCAIGASPPSEQDHSALIIHIWFANTSQGLGTIVGVRVQEGYFTATNAEWIVERPSKNPGPPYVPAGPLANYGTVTFQYCSAVMTGTKAPADLTDGTAISMVDVNDVNIISIGQILNSSTVSCTWEGYE